MKREPLLRRAIDKLTRAEALTNEAKSDLAEATGTDAKEKDMRELRRRLKRLEAQVDPTHSTHLNGEGRQ